jgi:hypothetical protein
MAIRRIALAVVVGTALLTIPVRAHHNMSAVFDFNDRVTLSGTLTKLDWRNPHIELELRAQRDSGEEAWKAEGPSPLFFRTRDTSKEDFQSAIGKTIKIELSRARDGSHSGLLRTITLADGKSVSMCPENC